MAAYKLWRADFYDDHEGTCVSWHGTETAANAELKRQQDERGTVAQGPEGVEPVEIPTDKAGLIAWLNANLNRDNG